MHRALTLALLGLAAAGCSSGPALYSADPLTPETAVDGDAREWPVALRPVPREAGLSVGLRRGDDDLVVVVVASDERQARRIALGGLRVWVDPEGGTDKTLGVRYPAPDSSARRELRPVGARRGTGPDPDRIRRRFEAGLDQIEITRGAVRQRASPDGRFGGLEAAATWGQRGLVIEMRIPLAATPGLLTTAPTESVSLGFELAEAVGRPMGGGRRGEGGGMGPRTGGAPPDGTRPDGEPRQRPEVEIQTVTRWLRVDL